MTPLEKYLHDLHEIHSSHSAVDETPYYGSLEVLLNEIGKSLKPRVRCIIHPKNKGAGLPDGGLFTAEQFDKKSGEQPKNGQLPARGSMEVKSPAEDAVQVALSEQVIRYLSRYQQVLVTNLRQFVLVGRNAEGHPAILEKYELAESEAKFWKMTARARTSDEAHGVPFTEYLRRVFLHAAPLTAPEDVAFFLASYARDALFRTGSHDLPVLASVRKALEEALGLQFEGEKGEHFFRSTLVQTLFYGVFSAWVLWSKQHPPCSRAHFDWDSTSRLLRVPVLRKLFHEVTDPGHLEKLNLVEVLDWTASVLNRVDRAAFFSKFQENHAVQYFYEPFLEAFDPELRKALGVWYTPPEIVEYMVERVDTVLRDELGLPDGLADKNVYVLDPCCGTASYLVEVLKKIHQTLKQRGEDALLASDLKDAAQKRVFGFELLPAPFVVAHLQLGLLLQNLGAPLPEKGNERVGVYLTNALTGWEPPTEPKKRLLFPELEEERDAAELVKRDTPILVIIGNPPYNGFAGVSPDEEDGLLDPYKQGLKEWGITKNYLDDLYIRFFRIAERRVAEMTSKGIICYISNFSYLSDPSFVVLRKRFFGEFDKVWIDCMNGDSRQTGKVTPDGKPDPSVFSTDYNAAGIRVGTAVSLMVRLTNRSKTPTIRFRHFWGAQKRTDLLRSLELTKFDSQYQEAHPASINRFSFRPIEVSSGYNEWPFIADLCAVDPMLGLNDNRGQAVHDISKDVISKRMRTYFDADAPFEELAAHLHTGLTTDAASFDARATRARLLNESKFNPESVWRFWFKPFDLRWAYIERVANLWNRVRPDLLDQSWEGNRFLLVRRHAPKFPDGATLFYSRYISDQHALHTDAYFIPFYLKENQKPKPGKISAQLTLGGAAPQKPEIVRANLSDAARAYLKQLGLTEIEKPEIAALIWNHCLSTGFTPTYLEENADGIRQDWPRIPLPSSKKALQSSAGLGSQLAALLDIDEPLKGVTTGTLRPELKGISMLKRVSGGSLHENDLMLSAGWGHGGMGGITMPGQGKLLSRDYSSTERDAIFEGTKPLGLSAKQAFNLFGEKTCDIYLNDVAFWSNVPQKVWEYSIGGNQVIKKWLSYREKPLIGRALTKDEVRYVQEIARRIAALLLLHPALDANYLAVTSSAFPWGS
jgi:type ISP restriction-modification system protein/N-6 DNA methylase